MPCRTTTTGARGVGDAMLGNRPQEETGQLSAAVTAEHKEVGADCCFEECDGWAGLHYLGGVLDAWGIAENRGDRLSRDSLSIYEKVVVIVDRREWVADQEVPGHEDVEWAACQGRLPGRPCQRFHGRRRAVDPDHNPAFWLEWAGGGIRSGGVCGRGRPHATANRLGSSETVITSACPGKTFSMSMPCTSASGSALPSDRTNTR